MGKDHTLYALHPGFIVFNRHPITKRRTVSLMKDKVDVDAVTKLLEEEKAREAKMRAASGIYVTI